MRVICNIRSWIDYYTCLLRVKKEYDTAENDAIKFPGISLAIRGTADYFNRYSYYTCTISAKANS